MTVLLCLMVMSPPGRREFVPRGQEVEQVYPPPVFLCFNENTTMERDKVFCVKSSINKITCHDANINVLVFPASNHIHQRSVHCSSSSSPEFILQVKVCAWSSIVMLLKTFNNFYTLWTSNFWNKDCFPSQTEQWNAAQFCFCCSLWGRARLPPIVSMIWLYYKTFTSTFMFICWRGNVSICAHLKSEFNIFWMFQWGRMGACQTTLDTNYYSKQMF